KKLMSRMLTALAVATCALNAAQATPPGVQIDEVMAGANGDARAQFIELRLSSPADNLWGPQPGETQGRLRLGFSDARGNVTGQFVFSNDAPVSQVDPDHGGYCVLVGTAEFAALPGAPAPDFLIAGDVIPQTGRVCLTSNPNNPNSPEINLCLSYGNYVADTGMDTLGQPAGPPTPPLPIPYPPSLHPPPHIP